MSRTIAYYLARGWITDAEARAGQRFSSTLSAAQRWLDDRDPADRAGAVRARDAMRELGELRSVAVECCARGSIASAWAERQGLPPAEGIVLLRAALSALVAHYRMAEANVGQEDAA